MGGVGGRGGASCPAVGLSGLRARSLYRHLGRYLEWLLPSPDALERGHPGTGRPWWPPRSGPGGGRGGGGAYPRARGGSRERFAYGFGVRTRLSPVEAEERVRGSSPRRAWGCSPRSTWPPPGGPGSERSAFPTHPRGGQPAPVTAGPRCRRADRLAPPGQRGDPRGARGHGGGRAGPGADVPSLPKPGCRGGRPRGGGAPAAGAGAAGGAGRVGVPPRGAHSRICPLCSAAAPPRVPPGRGWCGCPLCSAAVPPRVSPDGAGGDDLESGRRESNPHFRLGKPVFCH